MTGGSGPRAGWCSASCGYSEMFGYVLPPMELLPEEERRRFRSVYCGLCRCLGQRCGQGARMILNYDFTYLAILLSGGEAGEEREGRCLPHPVRARPYLAPTPAMELAADESVILAYWQLRDGVADSRGAKREKYRLAAAALKGGYERAAAARPGFDAAVRQRLGELSALEAERCPSLDAPADAFAQLLSAAAEEAGEERERRVLRQLLYHLGRWVYLIDAADDLAEDFAGGGYNPLIHRYGLAEGKLSEEQRRDFVRTLDHSVHMMATAFELGDFGRWTEILEKTLYHGLFQVGQAVLDGTFHQRERRKKDQETV